MTHPALSSHARPLGTVGLQARTMSDLGAPGGWEVVAPGMGPFGTDAVIGDLDMWTAARYVNQLVRDVESVRDR